MTLGVIFKHSKEGFLLKESKNITILNLNLKLEFCFYSEIRYFWSR